MIINNLSFCSPVVDRFYFYFLGLMRNGLVQPAIATGLTTGLASLQDTVLNLERISTTPLPFAYQVHLRMSLWYVLTTNSLPLLPFNC